MNGSSLIFGRISLACEICRKRKRKCDGAKPVCSPCQEHSRTCQYSTEEGKRKRKFTADHVDQLQLQIAALKQYVHDLESSVPDFSDAVVASRKQCTALLLEDGNQDPDEQDETPGLLSNDDDGRLSSAVDEIGSMFWKMSIGSAGDKSFIGPSGNFCFPSSFPLRGSVGDRSLSEQRPETCSTPPEQYLRDGILVEELLDLFLQHANSLHQFISPHTGQSLLLNCTFTPEGDTSSLLLSAILAAGTCFSPRADAYDIGQALASYAERIALNCCRRDPSFMVVQALTILCWRELGLEHDNMAWMFNSMAASIVIHLGLHVDDFTTLATRNLSDVSSLDERKMGMRTFWQFFLMDRIATSMLGRQCTLPWRRVRTSRLRTILDDEATFEEVVFDAQCHLWLLHDQYMDQIYSFEFSGLDFTRRNKLLMDAREGLTTFYQEMDSRLQLGKVDKPSGQVFLHMSYQMSLLLIHRPYLREKPDSGPFKLALRTMTVAATSMARLIQAHRKSNSFRQAPFHIVHHILTAAIMHLLSATSSQSTFRQQSVVRLRTCLDALEEMQDRWNRARAAIRLLQEMAQRWKVVFALPMHLSSRLDAEPPEHLLLRNPRLNPRPDINIEEHVPVNSSTNYDTTFCGSEVKVPTTRHDASLGTYMDSFLPHGTEYDDVEPNMFAFDSLQFSGDPLDGASLDWLFERQSGFLTDNFQAW